MPVPRPPPSLLHCHPVQGHLSPGLAVPNWHKTCPEAAFGSWSLAGLRELWRSWELPWFSSTPRQSTGRGAESGWDLCPSWIPLPGVSSARAAQPWNEVDGIETPQDEGKPEGNLWSFINFPQPSIYHKVSNWKNKTKKADDYHELNGAGLRGVAGGEKEILQKLGEN